MNVEQKVTMAFKEYNARLTKHWTASAKRIMGDDWIHIDPEDAVVEDINDGMCKTAKELHKKMIKKYGVDDFIFDGDDLEVVALVAITKDVFVRVSTDDGETVEIELCDFRK